jgi:hypothetical protein
MTKRPKQLQVKTPDEVSNIYLEFAERFSKLRNQMLVLADDPSSPTNAWVDALEDLDDRGDKRQLIALLRSKYPMLDEARDFLADLIERGVAKPPGKPRTPKYRASDKETALAFAHSSVKRLIKQGKTHDEAIAVIAEEIGVLEKVLANSYAGKRGSAPGRKKSRATK